MSGKIMKMSVTINIPQFLQHLTGDVVVASVNGRTVGECLGDLVQQFPQLKARLFTEDGQLLKYLDVYINGESAYPEELAKTVNDGGELHIIKAIVGG
jgi:molybdopterin synthase sulfur carrier subunit